MVSRGTDGINGSRREGIGHGGEYRALLVVLDFESPVLVVLLLVVAVVLRPAFLFGFQG
jgi:hypothetical protein